MGAFDLIAKAAKGVKNAPFFSKADVVLDELQRGKGTGDEFLTELIKKGVKPTEIKDRGLDKALKGKPKMAKAEVQKIFQERPAPRVYDEIRGGKEYEDALDEKAQEIIGDNYATFDDLHGSDRDRAELAVEQDFGYNPQTTYGDYVTPGGENYREILLRLPLRGLNENEKRDLMEYEAALRRGDQLSNWHQMKYDALVQKKALGNQDYQSYHFEGTPNILAHIRVQDFISPTYTREQAEDIGRRIADGMGVADHKNLGSGSVGIAIKNGYVTPTEAAQYADFRGFQGVDKTGAKRKVLLVDEIQSDWHQAGRKKGYKSDVNPEENKLLVKQWDTLAEERRNLERIVATGDDADPVVQNAVQRLVEVSNGLNAVNDRLTQVRTTFREGVPDAPFKKNWHELAMKRVLDYAAENGYDTVAITPGAEQAKRYDLSKHLQKINYGKNPDGTFSLTAVDINGRPALSQQRLTENELESMVGKEVAQKMIAGEGIDFPAGSVSEGMKSLSGLDLQVGGEGMKGFYDKILPDYLNNYGKQYGAKVGEIRLPVAPTDSTAVQGYNLGDDYMQGRAVWSEFLQANPGAEANFSPAYHAIDITPQMREEIKTKGQPLYSKIGVPGAEATAGAATIGSQMFDENNEQGVQNPVHFTENPDAMLLELMQRN